MATHQKNNVKKDEDILVSIVKEMTKSFTGAQSTKYWAEDALWFDIPPFASKGIGPAIKMFDNVFKSFKSCKIVILETEVILGEDMGVVCTVQKVEIVL